MASVRAALLIALVAATASSCIIGGDEPWDAEDDTDTGAGGDADTDSDADGDTDIGTDSDTDTDDGADGDTDNATEIATGADGSLFVIDAGVDGGTD